MTKLISKFDDGLEFISRWGLIISLLAILGLAVSGIVMRWCGSSVMWLDPLTRHLVFLSAFLGGSLATKANVHIRVDLLSKLIEMTKSKILIWVHLNILNFFSTVVCAALAWAAYEFFKVELEFGAPAFLDIHSGWLVFIIPAGMTLIALRFFNQLLLGILNGAHREHPGV